MFLTDKIWKRRKQKVRGSIINWVQSQEGSYPIVQFITKDGKRRCGLLTDMDILRLEAMPIKVNKTDMRHIHIIYDEDNPYCFTGYYY